MCHRIILKKALPQQTFLSKKTLKNKSCRQILFTDSIVNLRKKLIIIEHAWEHPQAITCMDKPADAQENRKINDVNVKLVTALVFHKKVEKLNFDEEHLSSN